MDKRLSGAVTLVLAVLLFGAWGMLRSTPSVPAAPSATPQDTPVPTPPPPARVQGVLEETWKDVADDAFHDLGEGLRIADITVGDGEALDPDRSAQFEYRLWTADGDLLGGSHTKPPAIVKRGTMIPGWEKGMLGMAVGGVRQIRIPAALGFGERASGKAPPNTDLVLELVFLGHHEPRVPPTRPADGGDAPWTDLPGGARWQETVGEGAVERAAPGDETAIELTLWMEDGRRVDSTLSRNTPRRQRLGQYRLPAPVEATVVGMGVGDQRQVYVPPSALTPAHRPRQVPADANLLWDITLVELTKADEPVED